MTRYRIIIPAGILAILAGMGTLGAATWNLDWQDIQPVGLIEWRLSNGPSVATRAATFYGSAADHPATGAYHSLSPSWRYAGAQGISGASNARTMLAVKIDDVASTACASNVTAELRLTRFVPDNPNEGGDCPFGASLGSFFRTKTWSTCGAGVADFFSSSWFGTGGNNPIIVSHQDTGTPTAGTNFFLYRIFVTDSLGSSDGAFGCYKTLYF